MKNSKELVEKCSEQLNHIQQEEREGKMAEYPVIIFFFGEETFTHFINVKRVLDSNLANSSYLQYFHVYFEQENCKVENMLTKAQFSNISEAVRAASVEALGTEDSVFGKKDHVFFECLLSTKEDNLDAYYEKYLEIEPSHSYEDIRTLYLMIDQIEKEHEEKAQKIIDRIARQEDKFGTIYLLSNMLSSGGILREDRIWMNYRLVADIILLGNSRNAAADSKGGERSNYSSIIHGGIKTVAYIYMGKQIEDITRITLHCLMKQLYDKEWRECKKITGDEELTGEVSERLSITTDGMEELGRIFRDEIIRYMPGGSELQWLPWKDYKTYKREHRKKDKTLQLLDQQSCGVLGAYLRLNYEKKMKELMTTGFCGKIKALFRGLLQQKFSFMEMLYCFDRLRWQDLQQNVKVKFSTAEAGGERVVADTLLSLSGTVGKTAQEILKGEIDYFLGNAKSVSSRYKEIWDEVLRNQIGDVQVGEEMRLYYDNVVRSFLAENDVSSPFYPGTAIEEVLDKIAVVFSQLIAAQSVYQEPFEREMELRLQNKSAQEQRDILKRQVKDNIKGQGRLSVSYDYMENPDGEFCMIHENSIYKSCLGLEEPANKKIVFDLNRRDCLEMIEIYALDRPERIKLEY